MLKYVIILFLVVCFIILRIRRSHRISKNTDNPQLLVNHEFNYVFGEPGSGKSTLLAAVAQSCFEQGIPCFSTFPIEHAYEFEGFDRTYPSGSVFLFDEIYDYIGGGVNKGFLDKEVTMFFKTFRHDRYTIWACSQEADDVARRVRGVVTKAYSIVAKGKVSLVQGAEITEKSTPDGDRYVLKTYSPLAGFFSDLVLYRPDYYSDFDSYCRRAYKRSTEFKAW